MKVKANERQKKHRYHRHIPDDVKGFEKLVSDMCKAAKKCPEKSKVFVRVYFCKWFDTQIIIIQFVCSAFKLTDKAELC